MSLCTEGFNAHLVVCHDYIISFSSCSKGKDANVGSCMGQRRTFKYDLVMY